MLLSAVNGVPVGYRMLRLLCRREWVWGLPRLPRVAAAVMLHVYPFPRLVVDCDKLRDCAYVAKFVAFGIRIPSVSWSHHRVVSALAPPDQKRWLRAAQPKEGETKPRLSVSELKAAIRAESRQAEKLLALAEAGSGTTRPLASHHGR